MLKVMYARTRIKCVSSSPVNLASTKKGITVAIGGNILRLSIQNARSSFLLKENLAKPYAAILPRTSERVVVAITTIPLFRINLTSCRSRNTVT